MTRSVTLRPVAARRPGMVNSRRRSVRAAGTVVSGGPIRVVQRSRLCDRAAISPGQLARPRPVDPGLEAFGANVQIVCPGTR